MPSKDAETAPLLRLAEAAGLIHVHPDTLRRWADAGRVPVYRTPTGERRFRRDDLLAAMSAS